MRICEKIVADVLNIEFFYNGQLILFLDTFFVLYRVDNGKLPVSAIVSLPDLHQNKDYVCKYEGNHINYGEYQKVKSVKLVVIFMFFKAFQYTKKNNDFILTLMDDISFG